MLYSPPPGFIRLDHNTGAVGADAIGTLVTTGAALSTKGAVSDLITSTAFDSYRMVIQATDYGAGAVSSVGAMDILIGAATESIYIPNLLMGFCSGGMAAGSTTPGLGKWWDFPLYTPAGSRLSCQAAGERLSTAFRVAIYLYGGNGYPPFGPCGTKVTTYGMGTVPFGTVVTPGATGVEGAWTQIVLSTTEAHIALLPSYQLGTDTATAARYISVDLGIGAAQEEEIAQAYWYQVDNNEKIQGPMPMVPCYRNIPAGSRLSMRASNMGTNDSGFNGVIHAVS